MASCHLRRLHPPPLSTCTTATMTFLKWVSDQVIYLLKAFGWFTIVVRVRSKYLRCIRKRLTTWISPVSPSLIDSYLSNSHYKLLSVLWMVHVLSSSSYISYASCQEQFFLFLQTHMPRNDDSEPEEQTCTDDDFYSILHVCSPLHSSQVLTLSL